MQIELDPQKVVIGFAVLWLVMLLGYFIGFKILNRGGSIRPSSSGFFELASAFGWISLFWIVMAILYILANLSRIIHMY